MKTKNLEQALEKIPRIEGLRIKLHDAKPQHGPGQLQLTVTYKGNQHRYNVHARSDLNTTAVAVLSSRLAASADERSNYLLYAPHVNTTCGERLRQHGIGFIDDVGDLHIQTPNLYLFVVGCEPGSRRGGARISGLSEARDFKTATLKMIYAFLGDPELDGAPGESLINRNYREISEGTGIALGSVSNAMEDLRVAGYVVEQSPGRRQLVNRRKLFERWVQDYGAKLRPKLVVSHFRAPSPRWWQNAKPESWGGLWGGEVGGAKTTGFLTPETATLYAEHVPDSFILEHDLRKDPAGGVEILRPFWQAKRQSTENGCVHPIVIYADLAATDIDRNLQTAQRIYERHIRNIVEST